MENNTGGRDEQLLRYLDNQMTAGERTVFETEMKNDPSLAGAYSDFAAARLAVIRFGAEEEVAAVMQSKRLHAQNRAPVVSLPTHRSRMRFAITAAAAAVVIAFSVIFFNNRTESVSALYAEAYSPYEPVTARAIDVTLTPMDIAYANKDHAAVQKLFEAEVSPTQKQMLLAGVSYLETKKPADAVRIFRSLLAKNEASGTKSFSDEARYYLALAELQNKNYPEAVKLMEAVHADAENPFHDKFSPDYIEKVKKLIK